MSSNDLNTPEFSALTVTDDEALGTDEFSAVDESFDPLAGAEDKRRIDSGIVLIVIVVLLAGGGLFSMRTIANASANSITTNPQIDSTIDKWFAILAGPTGNGDDTKVKEEVLGVLSVEQYSEQQVPLQDVQRNPFVLGFEKKPEIKDPVVSTSWDPDEIRRAEQRARMEEFKNASTGFTLTSVLAGETPLASLNNKIVRIGDTVISGDDVPFKVHAIDSDSVTLIASDAALEIAFEVTVTVRD